MAEERQDTIAMRLAAYREALDAAIAEAGSVDRLKRKLVGLRRRDPLFDIAWRRVAAAVVVATIAGGAVGLALPDRNVDTVEVATLDPLSALDPGGSP
jgi:hypothetical protein